MPATVDPASANLFTRWQVDPVAFAREALGITTLWSKQVDVLRSVAANRETNVPSGHACGKDFLASILVPWFLVTNVDSVVITTATKALQVEKILWAEIRARINGAKVALGGNLAPAAASWQIGPKWYALGITAADPNGFAGFRSTRILVIRDEAAGISPEIWEASESLAAGDSDRILSIGNPICGPVHPFAKACADTDEDGKRRTIRMASIETPNYVEGRTVVPGLAGRDYVESMARKYGRESVIFGARVLGLFPGSASDGLISMEHLQLARDRLARKVKPADEDVVRLGCDPARYGDDLSCIEAAHGPLAWPVAQLAKYDGERLANRLVLEINRLHARSVAIDSTGGYGSSPADFLRKAIRDGQVDHDCQVYEVNFGAGSSNPDKWANRRTELWWRLRDWIREDAAYDPDDTTTEELLAATYKPHGEGVALEPKDKLKERIGRSPDRADALALAVAGHVESDAGPPVAPAIPRPLPPVVRRGLEGFRPRR